MLQLVTQYFPTAASSVFAVPAGWPTPGNTLLVQVQGVQVPYVWSSASTITLGKPASVRSIVSIFNDTNPANGGNVAAPVLAFSSVPAQSSLEMTCTVTGAELNDIVSLGLPANVPAGCSYDAYVSAVNTVRVRCTNVTTAAVAPPPGTFRVSASKT